MSQAPLTFVGVAAYDTIACVQRFPQPDERLVVDDMIVAGGGPAATAAVAAARRGASVAFVGVVGDDSAGAQIIAGLAAEGVDVSHVVTQPGIRSATSIVIVDTSRSSRAILNLPPTPLHHADLPAATRDRLARADWIHVDQAGWATVADWWRSTEARPRLSIDAGNPIEGFSAAGIDLYVPTISALRHRFGDAEPEVLLQWALDEGAHTVVATDGRRGAHVLREGDSPFRVAAVDGPVVSTLGAGDVFHGALLAAVARGESLADAVAEASGVAYQACQALDGRSAIPTYTPDRSRP